MPKDFKDATIVQFFKNKGSKTGCRNNWGIFQLSISGMFFFSMCHLKPPYYQHFIGKPTRDTIWFPLAAAPLTWFLQSENSRRSLINRIRICTLLLYIWPSHLTWSTEKHSGVHCQNMGNQEDTSTSSTISIMTLMVLLSPLGNFQINLSFLMAWSRVVCCKGTELQDLPL